MSREPGSSHRPGGRRRHVSPLLLVWLSSALPQLAAAADFQVTSDVAAQGYQVDSPWGDRVVGRRRLTSMVGLGAYNLQGDYQPLEPDYSMVMRLRFDTDFGIESAEQHPERAAESRYLPGLDRPPLDLMVGYVQARNLAGGWLTLRAGRQQLSDVLGWWSFDGALVRIVTPFFLQVEAYGGAEQRGGLPLSTNRYESQGVWRGDRSVLGTRPADYPSFQPASPGPAFGVAAETNGPSWIHGRFSYRRVYNTGVALTDQFPASAVQQPARVDGGRISSESFGYATSGFIPALGAVRAGFAYDVHNELIRKAYATAEAYLLARRVTIGADADFFVPTFDADSIFNWFTHNPVTTLRLRGDARPLDTLSLSAAGGVRLWMADGDPLSWAQAECVAAGADVTQCTAFGVDPSSGGAAHFSREPDNRQTSLAPDALGAVGARYRWRDGSAALSGDLQVGAGDAGSDRGRRVGATLMARQALAGEAMWLGARTSIYDWTDPLRPTRGATSFGYVLAPEYRPAKHTYFRVEWEHDMNRLVGQRFRVLALLRMEVGP